MSTLHTPAAPRTHHHRARAQSRDPFFDNAKMLLVTLVVVGHSWTLLPDVSTSSPVYVFLYTFHVPAFVLVTGYLSRSFTFTRANLRKLVTTVVVPVLRLRDPAGAVPHRRRPRELRGALHQPALADVVPHGAVPVAAGHPAADPAAARPSR